MAAKKTPNAAARPAWTAELVAQRAADLIHKKNARRRARDEYGISCERFKTRRGIDYLETSDPNFRRSTRKAYDALQVARNAERNAMRRLETAVRNCPASAFAEPAKAPEATQPKGSLAGNLAIAEAYARMLNISPNERLALVRKVAAHHGIDVAELLGDIQGAA
ncbi:hypothetical protein [Paraburkholderia ginsengisoli]|uniref:Uncharacterized protein n=1 Tax=Paraburkholderia ginsengisoli TaxID=311231 RepID=A0A7T4N216_9BURK|nr:hypothetical protein [Paraburkholderia ginsengisoli]QQC63796.1 hypothetical protein I6I06_16115 [Paraburkholderia ginsengisoli]